MMEPKAYIPKELPLGYLDWERLIPEMSRADRAISMYNGILHTISNPQVLLSPLVFREAVISSRIEGTIVSLEEVLQYDSTAKDDSERQNKVLEVLNYRRALSKAISDTNSREHKISTNTICNLHRILMTNVRGEEKRPGDIRTTRVYIRGRNGSLFTAPEPDRVRNALKNWEDYLNQEERNPLVQLAILKAQFELIHPFYDGNGRVGRMLVPLILYIKGVLASPNFYISAYLDKNRDEYLDRLEDISKQEDWGGWVSFFLRAIKEQSEKNSNSAIKIINLHRDMERKISDLLRSHYSSRVVDTLFSNPIFNSNYFAEKSGIPKNTAKSLLKTLKENGVIEILLEGQGRRPTIYKFTKLLELTEQDDL